MKRDFVIALLNIRYRLMSHDQISEEFMFFCSEKVLDMCEYYDVNLDDMLKELIKFLDTCSMYTYDAMVKIFLDYEKRLTELLTDIKDNLYSDISSIAADRILEISARRFSVKDGIVGWVEGSFKLLEDVNDFLGTLCSSLMKNYVNIYMEFFKPRIDAMHTIIDSGCNFNISINCTDVYKNSKSESKNIGRVLNYKKLIKIAESKGFIYDRSNGDHRVYKHKETNKIVVIPSRDVGKGLSFAIQKQIELNSVT